jgi:hypothetical protein
VIIDSDLVAVAVLQALQISPLISRDEIEARRQSMSLLWGGLVVGARWLRVNGGDCCLGLSLGLLFAVAERRREDKIYSGKGLSVRELGDFIG